MPVRRRGRGGDPGIPGRPAGHVPLPDGSDLPTVPSHAARAGPAPPPLAGPRGNLRAPDQRRPPPRTRRENLGYFKPRDGDGQSKVISMSVQVQPTSPGRAREDAAGASSGKTKPLIRNREETESLGEFLKKRNIWVQMQLEKLPWRGRPVPSGHVFYYYFYFILQPHHRILDSIRLRKRIKQREEGGKKVTDLKKGTEKGSQAAAS